MAFKLSKRSTEKLSGVNPELVKVVQRAIEITSIDFAVIEGVRTVERQQVLFAQGASKTMKSRHITGHAVDLAAYIDGGICWDWPLYDKLAEAMKDAARELQVPIEWGGDWTTFKDGPHFQLSRSGFPA